MSWKVIIDLIECGQSKEMLALDDTERAAVSFNKMLFFGSASAGHWSVDHHIPTLLLCLSRLVMRSEADIKALILDWGSHCPGTRG